MPRSGARGTTMEARKRSNVHVFLQRKEREIEELEEWRWLIGDFSIARVANEAENTGKL